MEVNLASIITSHIETGNIAFGRIHVKAPEAVVVEADGPNRSFRNSHCHLVGKTGDRVGDALLSTDNVTPPTGCQYAVLRAVLATPFAEEP